MPSLSDLIAAAVSGRGSINDKLVAMLTSSRSKISQLELQTIRAYGASWIASDTQNVANGRYIQRLHNRAGSATLTNHGLAGSIMPGTAHRAIGTSGANFAAGTKALVVLDALGNQLGYVGYTTDQRKAGSRESLRAFLSAVSASSRIEQTAMTRTGTWTLSSVATWSGGSSHFTSTAGDHAEFTAAVNATGKIGIGIGATDDAASGLVGAAYSITVDGIVVATGTASNKHFAVAGVPENANSAEMVVVLSGLTPGNRLIRITHAGVNGQFMTVDAAYIRAINPPPILVLGVPQLDWATLAATYGRTVTETEANEFNAAMAGIVSDYPNAAFIDPRPGFSRATMMGSDSLHMNDKGHAYYADLLESAARALPWTAGLHTGV